jgi:hypothetical protein
MQRRKTTAELQEQYPPDDRQASTHPLRQAGPKAHQTPVEDSTSSWEESDQEGIKEQEEDVEGIGDIVADENMRITKGLMVDCDPELKHFLRHIK